MKMVLEEEKQKEGRIRFALYYFFVMFFSFFGCPLSTGQSKIGRRRPISLDNHCVFISQRISTNKISLERSFPYLNVDT